MIREAKLKAYSEELRYQKKFTSNVNIKEFKDYAPSRPYARDVKAIPSYQGPITGTTSKAEAKQYSGDYITGLATMHKSNIMPVGRDDDPASYATMRRN